MKHKLLIGICILVLIVISGCDNKKENLEEKIKENEILLQTLERLKHCENLLEGTNKEELLLEIDFYKEELQKYEKQGITTSNCGLFYFNDELLNSDYFRYYKENQIWTAKTNQLYGSFFEGVKFNNIKLWNMSTDDLIDNQHYFIRCGT